MKLEMIQIITALSFSALDLLSGLIKAWKSSEGLNSTKLRDGIFKKCGWILCYTLAMALKHSDHLFGFNFPVDLVPIICGYGILTEVVSIIENIAVINSDILPEKLKNLIGLSDINK